MQGLAVAVSQPILRAMQKSPSFAHFIHVLFNAVPDISFALLAVAGLSYLMPEIATKLEAKRGVRYFLLTLFGLFGCLAIWVNAVNRTEQEQLLVLQSTAQGQVLSSVIDIQKLLHSSKTLTEAEKMTAISESLRDEYVLTHTPVDPDILERVSKIGSASNQVLTFWAVELLSFCHEEAAKAVNGRAVEID